MPIIEFSCTRCGHKFDDLIMKKGEIESVRCPKCRSNKVKRLFSVFGICGKGVARSSTSSCSSCARTSCEGCSS